MNSCDFRRFSPPNLPRSTSFPHFTKRHMTPSGLPSVQRWQWWVLLPSQNLWGSLKTHKLINCPTHTNPAPLLSPCPANNSKHSHSPSFNRPRHKPVFTVAGVDAPLLPVGFANLSGVVPDLMPRLERRWWSWWKKWGQYLYHPVPVYSLDSSWHGQSRAKMPWQSEIIQDPSILQNLKMESLVQPFWQPPLRLVGPSIPPTHSHLSAEDLSDDRTFLYFEFWPHGPPWHASWAT